LHNFIEKRREILSKTPTEIKVISLPEIIFIFGVFCFVLYMLFPKETLKQKVLKEKKSNDLAIVYIKNIVKFDNRNYELLFHYADIHFKENHFLAVKRIVELLLQSNIPDIREKAILLGEKLFKRQFFLLKKTKEREKLLKEYQNMLTDMLLVSHDENFQTDILNYLAQSDDKNKYISMLKKLAKIDDKWKMKLATHHLAHNKLNEALMLYEDLLQNAQIYSEKKKIFVEAIKVLTYGGFFTRGVKIMQKYEDLFLYDDEVFEKIVRFYLAAGKQTNARKYILKRLKH